MWSRFLNRFVLFGAVLHLFTLSFALAAEYCAPEEAVMGPPSPAEIEAIFGPPEAQETLVFEAEPLEISLSVEEAKQVIFKRWSEASEFGQVSAEAQTEYESLFAEYGIVVSDEVAAYQDWISVYRLPEAVSNILGFYLRWSNPSIRDREQSGALPDMRVSLDPSLAEFLGLAEDDDRLLSEVLLDDLLKSSEGQMKILELNRKIRLFSDLYISALAGPQIARETRQLMAELPPLKENLIQGRGRIPRLEEINDFIQRYETYREASRNINSFRPIYRGRLNQLLAENENKLMVSHIFEAFNFTPEEIAEYERLEELRKKLEALDLELIKVSEHPRLSASVPSSYRFGASILDHHEDYLDSLRSLVDQDPLAEYERGLEISNIRTEYLNRARIARATNTTRFRGLEVQSAEPSISGFLESFESRFLEVLPEVEAEFFVSFEDRNYKKHSFEKRGFANPASFLPDGARYKSNGRWAITEVYRGESGTGIFAGRQTPLGAMASTSEREITESEFKRYERQAILRETWRRLQADGFVDDIGMLSLKKIVEDGEIYGPRGFFEEGISQEKAFEWYDPILERMRKPDDVIDFEKEVQPKYDLALYVLNQASPNPNFKHLPREYSHLLMWKTDELVRLAFLREQFENFGLGEIPRTIVYLGQTEGSSDAGLRSLSEPLLRESFAGGMPPSLIRYDEQREYKEQIRARGHDLPAWAFSRTSHEFGYSASAIESLARLQIEVLEWRDLKRAHLGADFNRRLDDPEHLKESIAKLKALIDRKQRLAPGPSFADLGCFDESLVAGSLLPDSIKTMSPQEFRDHFRSQEQSRKPLKLASTAELFSRIEKCLDKIEAQKQELAAEVASSFESNRVLEFARNARRLRNARIVLEAARKGEEPQLLPAIDEVPEDDEQMWEDYWYSMIGKRILQDNWRRSAFKFIRDDQAQIHDPVNLATALAKRFEAGNPESQAEYNELNALFAKLLYTAPADLTEAELKQREALFSVLNQTDQERINRSPSLRGLLSESLKDFYLLETLDLSEWTVFELDSLDFLAKQYAWDELSTDTGLSGFQAESLFWWLYSDLKPNAESGDTSESQLRPRLSLIASGDLMESAEQSFVAESIIPVVWGEDFRKLFPDEDVSPLQIRALGIEDAPRVLDFILQHQVHALEYIWGPREAHDSPKRPGQGLNEAFSLSHDTLDVLSRWRVPTDPEHLNALLRFGDSLVWKPIIEEYLTSLSPREREKKSEEFKDAERAPSEVVEWFLKAPAPVASSFGRISIWGANQVFESFDLSDDIILNASQERYLANLGLGVNNSSSAALAQPLTNYSDFMIGFFGSDRQRRQEFDSIRNQGLRGGDQSAEAFLQLVGFDLKSALVQKALANIRTDNKALTKDLNTISKKFFETSRDLEKGPLSREQLQKIVFESIQDEDLNVLLTGIEKSGKLFEGSSMRESTAERILTKAGIADADLRISGVADQLSKLRAFVLNAQELFHDYQGSLSESVVKYVNLEVFRALDQDPDFQQALAQTGRVDPISSRLEALKNYLDILGYKTGDEVENLEAELSRLLENESADLDGVFRALESYIEVQQWRYLPQTIWANASISEFEAQSQRRLDVLKQALRLSEDEALPEAVQAFLDIFKSEPESLKAKTQEAYAALAARAAAPAPTPARSLGEEYSEAEVVAGAEGGGETETSAEAPAESEKSVINLAENLSPEASLERFLKPEELRKIRSAWRAAFPRSSSGSDFRSIYAEMEEARLDSNEKIRDRLKAIYGSVIKDQESRRRRELLQALPYSKSNSVRFDKDGKAHINPEWQVHWREEFLRSVIGKDASFFITANKETSAAELVEEMFQAEGVYALKDRLGAFWGLVDATLVSSIENYNEYNLKLLHAEGDQLTPQQLKAFSSFVLQSFRGKFVRAHSELAELMAKDRLNLQERQRLQEIEAELEFGYRAYFQPSNLRDFLQSQSVPEELQRSLLTSPAVRIQLEQVSQLATDMENVHKVLSLAVAASDPSIAQNELLGRMIQKSREFFKVGESLTDDRLVSQIAGAQALEFSDLVKGIQSINKDQLEGKYEELKMFRAERKRKDRYIVHNVAVDVGMMIGMGVVEIGAIAYRLGLENAVVNLSSGFGLWDEDMSIGTSWARGMSGFLGTESISNFSDEALERTNDEILSQVVFGDGVGALLTVASFGGLSVAKLGIQGTRSAASAAGRGLQTGVRASARVVPAGVRHRSHAVVQNMGGRLMNGKLGSGLRFTGERASAAGTRIQSFMTKERHLPSYRGPATTQAASRAIGIQAERMVANQAVKPTSATALGRAWDATRVRAGNFARQSKAAGLPIGLRLGLDSAVIGAGAMTGVYMAYGALNSDQAKEIFSDEFIHGFQFIAGIMLAHYGMRALPKATGAVLPNRGAYAATQKIIERMAPLGEKALSGPLIIYIGTDATRNITGSLMVESETFRDVVNTGLPGAFELFSLGMLDTSWSNQLTLEEREYEQYLLPEYMDEHGAPSKWVGAFENGAEMLMQWQQDRDRIAAAISGAFIVGIIAGGPMVGLASDKAAYSQMKRADESAKTASRSQRFYETVSNAYGGNPRRSYEWALRDKRKALQEENQKLPEAERKTDEQIEAEALAEVQRSYLEVYEQMHPEHQISRLAEHWTLQGRDMEALRRLTLESLQHNYGKIFNEMHGGERLNPILRRANPHLKDFVAEQRMMGADEVVSRFNKAWDEGVRRGQELKIRDLDNFLSNENIPKHLEAFHLLGQRLESYLVREGRNRVETADIWKILEEFESRAFWESPRGQILLKDIVLPRVQAIEGGIGAEPLFMGYNLRSPDSSGTPRMSAADFAKLIQDRANSPEASALRTPVADIGNTGKSNIYVFYSSITKDPIAQVYQRNGKRYLEVANQKIELLENIEVDVKNNGRVVLYNSNNKRSSEFGTANVTDVLGSWGLRSEEAPNLLTNLRQLYAEVLKADDAAAPQIVMYDVVRVDPITGNRRTSSEPVVLSKLNENLDLLGLPDNTYLLSFKGPKPEVTKGKRNPRRLWLRRKPGVQQEEFISELHLAPGWKLIDVKGDTFTLRDRFHMESEINFKDQTVDLYYKNADGVRVKMKYHEDGQPMGLAEFRDLVQRFPGLLPTEVIMATELRTNQELNRESYSALADKVQQMRLRDHLRIMGSDQDASQATPTRVEAAFQKAYKMQRDATRESLDSGPLRRQLDQIPLPENATTFDLVPSINRSLLDRFYMDGALFERIKADKNYAGLEASVKSDILQRMGKDEGSLRAEDLMPFERLDLLNRLTPAEIQKYFSESDIQTAWRLTRRSDMLLNSREQALQVVNTWEVEKALRALDLRERPRTTEELSLQRTEKLQRLQEDLFVNHFEDLSYVVPREVLVDSILDRGLPVQIENFYSLQAGRITYEQFVAAGQKRAPGVNRESVREGLMTESWNLLQPYVKFSDVKDFIGLEMMKNHQSGRILPEALREYFYKLKNMDESYETLLRLELARN